MSKHLDLFDVAEGHPVAIEELLELRQAAARYETARALTPAQWKAAWDLNMKTDRPFDEIIDELTEERLEREEETRQMVAMEREVNRVLHQSYASPFFFGKER